MRKELHTYTWLMGCNFPLCMLDLAVSVYITSHFVKTFPLAFPSGESKCYGRNSKDALACLYFQGLAEPGTLCGNKAGLFCFAWVGGRDYIYNGFCCTTQRTGP